MINLIFLKTVHSTRLTGSKNKRDATFVPIALVAIPAACGPHSAPLTSVDDPSGLARAEIQRGHPSLETPVRSHGASGAASRRRRWR
jgi:hypothetical protein